jgi:DNA-directed RNA polymerase specialized sigma subunit
MKIPLNMGQTNQSSKEAQLQAMERDILASQRGDWNAKNSLVRTFTPLLTSLAKKRASESAKASEYFEAGKDGLFAAAKKYKRSMGADKFQIFALDFIEKSMDRVENPGFLARVFGRK